jgi:branched-chain amino acid aminotransferase
MKAYVDLKGRIRLFRPEMNMKRLAVSAERLCFPAIDGDAILACIEELVRIDERFIPRQRGFSLYLRPTLIATTPWLGVGPTNSALFFTIMSPVGPYYPTGFKPVQLFAETSRVRACEGGTGAFKLGANYAPTILPQVEAAKNKYSQVLWLYGPKHELTEVGTMNLFMFWINDQGEKELITPPLEGMILPGVTRDSILRLATSWNEFKVTERKFYMDEVVQALNEGRVLEMFGAGTAAIVSPINLIGYMGKDYKVPLDPADPKAAAGPIASRMSDTIIGIQYGEIEHEWSKVIS